MTAKLSLIATGLFALLQGCSSPTSAVEAVDVGNDGAITTPTTDAANAADSADAPAGSIFTLTLDDKPFAATIRKCGYQDDSTYRTLVVLADLADGRTLSVSFIYGYAGGAQYAPLGDATRDKGLVTIELAEPGDNKSTPSKFPWSGSGTLKLTAAGRDGVYAGSAEGSFTRGNAFSPDPRPPMKYRFAFRNEGT